MFYGVYEREGGQAQLQGEFAWPTLEQGLIRRMLAPDEPRTSRFAQSASETLPYQLKHRNGKR